MSLSQRILSNTAFQIVARVVASVGNFVVFILINRHLTEEAFGRYTYYITAFYLAGNFINFGANGIAIREVARGGGAEGTILGGVARFKTITALLAVAFITALAFVYEETAPSRLLVVLASLHLFCHALSTPLVSFHARLRFALPSVAQIVGTLAFLATALVAYGLGCRSPEVYLILYGVGNIVQSFIIFVASRPLVRLRFDQTLAEFAAFFREMVPIGLSAVAASLYMYMDTLILRELKGETAVGHYNEAYRLLMFALMVPQFFTQVLFPVLSRYHESEHGLFALLLKRALLYLLLCGSPLAVALQFLSLNVLHGLYRAPSAETVQVLQILGWATLCIFAAYPFITALTAARRQLDFMKIAILAGIVNLVLNLLWIPSYGILGAAWATVVTEGLVLVLSITALLRVTLFNPFSIELWKVPVATLAVGLVACLVREWGLLPALGTAAAGLVGVLLVLRCLPVDLLRGAPPTDRIAAESFGDNLPS
ncbi:MAG: flippase [Planctomycetota bacterium]